MHDTTGPALVLVGGGLQNALIALATLAARPEANVTVLERASRPCGNHTWSFHATDVPDALRPVIDRVAEHTWPDYDVHFPEGRRRVELGYASIGSDHLAALLTQALADAPRGSLRTNTDVVSLGAQGVTLADGERLEADLVVDARGPRHDPEGHCGYQKFFGLELQLAAPHGLERPLLMDATIEQVDGFRFVYALPFGPNRLLIEDTVFSTSPALEAGPWRERVLAEADARGWTPTHVLREEQGVLPMPWSGPGPAIQSTGPLRAGYHGSWFHPATGYSMPHAMRLATIVARHADDPAALLTTDDYQRLVRRERKQARFARFLNRLLFTGVAASTRWTVFQRFYGLPKNVIARFYACTLTPLDRARMLVGRPPRGFSLRSALSGSAIR